MKSQHPISFVVFAALCTLSGVCFVIEHNTSYLEGVRNTVTYVTNPVKSVAQLPRALSISTADYLQEHDELVQEIATLNRQLLEMHGVAQQYHALKQRYDILQEVLAVPVELDYAMQLVEVVGVIQDVGREEVIINVGSEDGMETDMVVLTPSGVLGRISRVHPHTSNVITIFDQRHALPVINSRSGVRTVVAGNGRHNYLTLEHVHRRSDIEVDDEIVTSGLGDVFPAGYKVGTVIATEEIAAESLIKVDVQPSVDLDSERFVYVILGLNESE